MKRLLVVCLLILCMVPSFVYAEASENSLYPIRENGLWGYMNRQGEVVIEPQWDHVELFEQGYATVSINSGDHEEMTFIIDQEGRSILDPAWEYLSGDVFIDPETDLCGFFDRKSGFLQEPVYEPLWPRDGIDTEFLIVARYSGTYEDAELYTYESLLRYGAVRKSDGKIIVPLEYTGGDYDDVGSSEGYILMANEIHGRTSDSDWGPEYHLFDGNGNEIIFPEGIEPCGTPHDGVLTIRQKLNNEIKKQLSTEDDYVYGLAKPDGTIITEPCYDAIFDASNGMVGFLQDHNSGFMGWLNLAGEVIVPPVCRTYLEGLYPEEQYFNDYLAFWDAETQCYVLVDRNGCKLYSAPYPRGSIVYKFNSVMSNHCFWQIVIAKGTARYQLMKIENSQVTPVTEPIYEEVGYSCSPDSVICNDETLLADEPIPVCMNGKCGFIDANGSIVIPLKYDAVMHFYGDLAMVEKDGKLAHIDHDGNTVWEEK